MTSAFGESMKIVNIPKKNPINHNVVMITIIIAFLVCFFSR